MRTSALVVAALLTGCIQADAPVELTESAEVPLAAIEFVDLEGRIDGGVGVPEVGPVPRIVALQGSVSGFVPLENASWVTANMSWTSPAPTRLELHLQSPSGNVHTAAQSPLGREQTLSLTVDPVEEMGEWILWVAPVGPVAAVEWEATVTWLTAR